MNITTETETTETTVVHEVWDPEKNTWVLDTRDTTVVTVTRPARERPGPWRASYGSDHH